MILSVMNVLVFIILMPQSWLRSYITSLDAYYLLLFSTTVSFGLSVMGFKEKRDTTSTLYLLLSLLLSIALGAVLMFVILIGGLLDN
ncbi:hypothetical protein GCM10010912_55850 [Paenibacillus albidus]|uniref:Uncharacterized protein n=1 Tax=Paenibacillus albidus TaxID=2041023 RepID=A0A917CZQ4_9BACL|nr:hypothetical protein GCM10010912_55850 [Paenibacillus albidus]